MKPIYILLLAFGFLAACSTPSKVENAQKSSGIERFIASNASALVCENSPRGPGDKFKYVIDSKLNGISDLSGFQVNSIILITDYSHFKSGAPNEWAVFPVRIAALNDGENMFILEGVPLSDFQGSYTKNTPLVEKSKFSLLFNWGSKEGRVMDGQKDKSRKMETDKANIKCQVVKIGIG